MSAIETLVLDELEAVATAALRRPLDAVVVGGGPTGATAARTLAAAGCDVALLEAGPLALLTHASSTELRFSGRSVRALQDALSYSPRTPDGGAFGALVACLGGRGVFWNGAAPRYLPEDFGHWPISYADLASAYAWAETELFVSPSWGRTAIADAVRRLLRLAGIPAEPEPFAVDASPSVDGWLSGTIGNPLALLLRSGLLGAQDGKLRVLANGFALGIERSGDTGPVEVAVRDQRGGGTHSIATESVILAAGGFESVRLAMTSELPDRSGLLGRRLCDHWFVRAYFPVPVELYSEQRPEAGAVLVRPTSEAPFQIEVHLPGRRFFNARAGGDWEPVRTEEYSAMVRAFAPTRSQDTSMLEVVDDSRPGGYVVHMETTPADLELTDAMRSGLERVRNALHADPAEIATYPLGSSYHEAGGAQMGASDRSGVVDPFGRFWAEPRVWVLDASAWPSIGCANPHLTLVAIARRQALQLAKILAARR